MGTIGERETDTESKSGLTMDGEGVRKFREDVEDRRDKHREKETLAQRWYARCGKHRKRDDSTSCKIDWSRSRNRRVGRSRSGNWNGIRSIHHWNVTKPIVGGEVVPIHDYGICFDRSDCLVRVDDGLLDFVYLLRRISGNGEKEKNEGKGQNESGLSTGFLLLDGVWRRQVARRFWEPKVIGSNPISPNEHPRSYVLRPTDYGPRGGKDLTHGVSPKGRATVFGTVTCGFDSYHSKAERKESER
jgi:hypothetical protein